MAFMRGGGAALYSVTLSKPSGVQQAIYGNFSAARQQEIVVSHGKVLQLLRPNAKGLLQARKGSGARGSRAPVPNSAHC